jgi:hypothetical protein
MEGGLDKWLAKLEKNGFWLAILHKNMPKPLGVLLNLFISEMYSFWGGLGLCLMGLIFPSNLL